MIIDCHTHIGRNDHIKASVDELLSSMDDAKIDKALVFAGRIGDAPNEWMLEQIAPYKDRLLGVAAANPLKKVNGRYDTFSYAYEDAIQISSWYQEGKIVACKFYTGYEHYFPIEAAAHLIELNKIGCPAIFHSGDCLNTACGAKLKYAHPLHIDEVAVDFPNMNFIIAHMGYPWHRDAAQVCFKNDNVYADISGFVYGSFDHNERLKFKKVIDEFLDIAPNDKLLFGTDFPISNQSSYVDILDTFYGNYLSAQTLTKNVQKAFHLK